MQISSQNARTTPDKSRYGGFEDYALRGDNQTIVITPNAYRELTDEHEVGPAIRKAMKQAVANGIQPYTGPIETPERILRIAHNSNMEIPGEVPAMPRGQTPEWVDACIMNKQGFTKAVIVFLQYAEAGNLMISFHDVDGNLVSAALDVEVKQDRGLPDAVEKLQR